MVVLRRFASPSCSYLAGWIALVFQGDSCGALVSKLRGSQVRLRQIVSVPPWVGLVQNLSLVLTEFWRGSNLTLIDKFLSSHDVAMQCWTTTDMRLYYNATTEPPLRTCLVSARTPSLLVSVLQLLEGARCQHWYTSERERVGVAPQKVIWYYNILL